MRRVAGSATLDLNRRMLIDEGTRYLGMALGADCILIRSRPELIPLGCAMGVMAVGTLQHTLFHRMMKGLGEGHFDVGMAVFAKLRLGGFEEGRFGLGSVVAVATDAAKACFGVGVPPKFGWTPAWQPRQVASTCLAEALRKLKIFVASPPESTWALPGPWQLSQVVPFPLSKSARRE